MQLHCVREVGLLKLESGLFLNIMGFQVQQCSNLSCHQFSVLVFIGEGEPIHVGAIDQRVYGQWSEGLALKADAKIVDETG